MLMQAIIASLTDTKYRYLRIPGQQHEHQTSSAIWTGAVLYLLVLVACLVILATQRCYSLVTAGKLE
jgi:hypothetical protein